MPHESPQKPRPIGRVMHVSKSTGNLILKAEGEASVGEFVFDGKRRRVGSVFDFFGPVSSPFLAVKLFGAEAADLVGEELYAVEMRHSGKRRRD